MADNVTLNAGSGGSVLATDEISSVHHQRVKMQYGVDGSATDVSATNPLPITDRVTGNWKVYAGTLTADADLDVNTDLGRNARFMKVWNDDPASDSFSVSIDVSGTPTFGDALEVKAGETLELNGLTIDQIRLTHSADAEYRVLVY